MSATQWLDYEGLRLLNVTWASPDMDHWWLVVTHLERQPWFMFAVLPCLLLALFYIYRWTMFKMLFVVGLAVAFSDAIAYRGIKYLVNRPRPFENIEIASWLRKVGDAHGPSFPSNHAANCFAGACILAWYFRNSGLSYIFYIFAALVAVSRVALGVHYPSDVICGAILGLIVGFIIRITLLHQKKWFWLPTHVPKEDIDSGNWRTRTRRLDED